MKLMVAWRLRDVEDVSPMFLFYFTFIPNRIMNILIWNCRGALKPQFRKTVIDFLDWHQPFLMVITETKLSGVRANEVIEMLPFDGAVMVDSIDLARGIWLLWRSDMVQVDVLAATEQEIHAIIQVRSQAFDWLIRVIYASPRFEERCILWNNLKMLATLHDLP